MRTIIFLLALALPLGAASIQIIVRNDGGTIKEDVTTTVNPSTGTGNEALLAIQDWRDSQLDDAGVAKFPDTVAGREAFWRAVLFPVLKRMVLQFPYSGLATKKAAEGTAAGDIATELDSAFQ
ncbi:hypothetical protein LCGC14_2744210 [marine sediment metagenome]|uniref:Uncharacterized protein n=1 Tax=marine sediment metagenome TaxID=412755 RepID=A0A0F8ZQR2_9ZZZZ